MCRNIRTLYNFDPPATQEEIRASALPSPPRDREIERAKLALNSARRVGRRPA